MAADERMAEADAKPADAVKVDAVKEEEPADVVTLVRARDTTLRPLNLTCRPHGLLLQLKRNAALLEKLVATKEARFAVRALRQVRAFRSSLCALLATREPVRRVQLTRVPARLQPRDAPQPTRRWPARCASG
jgi:hypothetical protein